MQLVRLNDKKMKKKRKDFINPCYACGRRHFKANFPFKDQWFEFGKLDQIQSLKIKAKNNLKYFDTVKVLLKINLNIDQNRKFRKMNMVEVKL